MPQCVWELLSMKLPKNLLIELQKLLESRLKDNLVNNNCHSHPFQSNSFSKLNRQSLIDGDGPHGLPETAIVNQAVIISYELNKISGTAMQSYQIPLKRNNLSIWRSKCKMLFYKDRIETIIGEIFGWHALVDLLFGSLVYYRKRRLMQRQSNGFSLSFSKTS